MHGPEFTTVFILCTTLGIGAFLRRLCVRLGVPYTLVVLVVGLLTGLALQASHHQGPLHLLSAGSNIGHELIIFVFLPALVFESAFSIRVHAFLKELQPVILLAVPALLLSTLMVGSMMFGLTRGDWGWSFEICLVFGALISATDPVAVVALLKELGAPKRLGLLIEGESLFNDGTSIVVFGVLTSLLRKSMAFEAGPTLGYFVLVTLGGLIVGLVLAMVCTAWLARTFNDPLVEISITLLLAYLSMLLAEGFFHVSGVMAVVAAGLWVSGPGRTAISPEVEHFLHRFWEVLSYLANTLIFFLVGLVIAAQAYRAGLSSLGLVLVAYTGVMVIRVVLVFLFRPAMPRVSSAEAAVIAWGGLRGAVSLALALLFAQLDTVRPEVREQMLLLTAGVVLLTILVNGSTLGPLLNRLGLDKPPAGSRLATLNIRRNVLKSVKDRVRAVSSQRSLRTVRWNEIESELKESLYENSRLMDAVREELRGCGAEEQVRGVWRQVLEIERLAYWKAYAQGALGAATARALDLEVDRAHDRLEGEPEVRSSERARDYTNFLRRVGKIVPLRPVRFRALTLRHDLARGQSMAAEAVLHELGGIEGIDGAVRHTIEQHYRDLQRRGRETLEDLRTNLPEMTAAVETRLAQRVLLYLEREAFEEQAQLGALDPASAEEAIAEVEQRMKAAARPPAELRLPETADLVHHAELFRGLGLPELRRLAEITKERVFSPGEILFSQGETGDSLFIIARGAVLVYLDEVLLDVLGGGDMIGEISLLTGSPRSCSIQAATTVTLGEICRSDFDDLLKDAPGLKEATWMTLARRRFEDHIRSDPFFQELGHQARVALFSSSRHRFIEKGQKVEASSGMRFLAVGVVENGQRSLTGPTWLQDGEWETLEEGWLTVLPVEADSSATDTGSRFSRQTNCPPETPAEQN